MTDLRRVRTTELAYSVMDEMMTRNGLGRSDNIILSAMLSHPLLPSDAREDVMKLLNSVATQAKDATAILRQQAPDLSIAALKIQYYSSSSLRLSDEAVLESLQDGFILGRTASSLALVLHGKIVALLVDLELKSQGNTKYLVSASRVVSGQKFDLISGRPMGPSSPSEKAAFEYLDSISLNMYPPTAVKLHY